MKKLNIWLFSALMLLTVFFAASCGGKGRLVSLDRSELTVEAGESVTLVLTVDKEDAEAVWSSSDTAVATVSEGVVTGLKEGTATVTVTVEKKYSASCAVTVVNTVERHIELEDTDIELPVGNTYELNPVLKEGNTTIENVEWSFQSEFPQVQVSAEGVIKGVEKGTATVVVSTVYLGKEYRTIVTVQVKDEIEFTLDKSELALALTTDVEGWSNSYQLVCTYKLNGVELDKTITWKSENEEIASVENGIVRAHSLGKVKIYARCGEEFAYVVVTVTRPVVELSSMQAEVDVNEDGTWSIALPSEYGVLTEISDGERVVSLTRDGAVMLSDSFVGGKTVGEEEYLYLNTDVKSFKISVIYTKTYDTLPVTSFGIPDASKGSINAFTKEEGAKNGRYGTYKYSSSAGSFPGVWMNRVGIDDLTSALSGGRYLAFDVYMTTDDVMSLWFFTKHGNQYQRYISLNEREHGSSATYPRIDGTQSVLVLNEEGKLSALKSGEWLTVVVDLETIYGGEVSDRFYFAFREAADNAQTAGMEAWFSRFRLYDETQYGAYVETLSVEPQIFASKNFIALKPGESENADVVFGKAMLDFGASIVWTTADAAVAAVDKNGRIAANRLGSTTVTASGSLNGETYSVEIGVRVVAAGTAFDTGRLSTPGGKASLIKAEETVGGRTKTYGYSVLDASKAQLWNTRCSGLIFNQLAIGDSRYVAIDIYLTGEISSIYASVGNLAVYLNYDDSAVNSKVGWLVLDENGNISNLVAGKWLTLYMDIKTVRSENPDAAYRGDATSLEFAFVPKEGDPKLNDIAYLDKVMFYTPEDFETIKKDFKPTIVLGTFLDQVEEKASIAVASFDLKQGYEILAGYSVKYFSSDEAVAVIDNDGEITGVGEGTVVITVTVTYDGKDYESSYRINVTAAPVRSKWVINSESVTDCFAMNSNTARANVLESLDIDGSVYYDVLEISTDKVKTGAVFGLDFQNEIFNGYYNYAVVTAYYPDGVANAYLGWCYPKTPGGSAAIACSGAEPGIYRFVIAKKLEVIAEGKEDTFYFTFFQSTGTAYILDIEYTMDSCETEYGKFVNSDVASVSVAGVAKNEKMWLVSNTKELFNGKVTDLLRLSNPTEYSTGSGTSAIGTWALGHIGLDALNTLSGGVVTVTLKVRIEKDFAVMFGSWSEGAYNMDGGTKVVTGTGEWQEIVLNFDASAFANGEGKNGIFIRSNVWNGVGEITIADIVVSQAAA